MPGSSNTSFIPKRNPTHNNRQNTKQHVFLGSFVIKILFFASIIAAIGVFAYETKLNSNLEDEIVKLNNAIASFNEADMERVLKMDLRLNQANQRLQYSASIASLLSAIEKSTTGSIQISELILERTDDKTFEIEASMKTGTFDSVLFQREVLENGDTLSISEIKDLEIQNVPPNNGLYAKELSKDGDSNKDEVVVSFKAMLNVETDKIPHQATPVNIFSNDASQSTDSEPVVEQAVTEDEVNQEEI